MGLNAQQIYEAILYRAADEWGVDTDHPDKDIGQKFDPLVRFLAGACAFELEHVYQYIENSEARLIERLIRVLLPEQMHLPTPASALAVADPIETVLELDETAQFCVDSDEKGREVFFAPLVRTRLFNVTTLGILTNAEQIPLDKRKAQRKNIRDSKLSELRTILFIAQAPVEIDSWKEACWYFEIKPDEKNGREAYRFYSLLPKSNFYINGELVLAEKGWVAQDFILEDYINGNARLHEEIYALYARQFIHFNSEPERKVLDFNSANAYFESWLNNNFRSDQIQTVKNNFVFEEGLNYVFFECRLPESVYINQMAYNLLTQFNVFPVINRRLCGAGNGEHHYLQSSAIKWIHIRPNEDFCSIRRVYEEKPPLYQLFTYKPFSEFREEKSPSYTLRHGGVGRLDEFNAWTRMAYLLGVIQESNSSAELLHKAAGSLSLEEIHQLLGSKMKNPDPSPNPVRDIYILLHSGNQVGMRVRVEYWTSLGAAANSINANVAMKCISRHSIRINQDSIRLVTTVMGGKSPMGSSHEMDSLKASMLSRGRIVTREDVKAFAYELLGEKIKSVSVRDAIGTDPDSNLGATRIIEVCIEPAAEYENEDWFHLNEQLRNLLQDRSASILPFKVVCQQTTT